MRPIKEPGKKFSDTIIAKYVSERLGIPVSMDDVHEIQKTATAQQDHPAPPATSPTPSRSAQDAGQPAMHRRSAAETPVLEYYKKLYPQEYVSQLTETPAPQKQKTVSYEEKPAETFPAIQKSKSPDVSYPDPKIKNPSLDLLPPNGPAKRATTSRMLTREQIAKICPECAEEMKRHRVRAISAQYLAKKIAERAQQTVQ